jgi:crotonobetainyl-CoA:carnitine CoA-transferase CaiB-like acyl-CoA transferase
MASTEAGVAGDTGDGALPPKSTALRGIRICDLSGILAGAGATRILAAFGAQVIRVEDPSNQGRWDIVRGSAPYVDDRRGIDLGGMFNNHNVEKLGITLNLRTDAGRELFLRLVACSDVVTENFSAGEMDRLGLGYEQLRAVNEQVIYVANSGFGTTGPYSRYKTFGPIVQAMSGLTLNAGLPGQEPAGYGYSYMDHMGANFMAFSILAALVHRNRSGRGTSIDMSCTDAGLSLAGPGLIDALVNERPPRSAGEIDSNAENFPAMAPHGIYPAAGDDSWIAIACRDDTDWERLAPLLGGAALADPVFATRIGRLARRSEVEALVADWTSARSAPDAQAALRELGVPAARVSSPEDRVDHDPATAEWGLWPTVRHSEIGEVRVDGLPMHLSATDWVLARGAPCLGEHNRQVYGELLGLADDELDALSAAGVI